MRPNKMNALVYAGGIWAENGPIYKWVHLAIFQ